MEISNFPTAMTAQRMPQWCWAASLESVFRHYGVSRTQEQIVLATYGSLVNMPAMSPYQLYGVLNGISFSERGGLEATVGAFGNGAPPPALLLQELGSDHPIIAWYINPEGGGHAVVIFGARLYGGRIAFLKFWDPWPGNGVRVVPAAQLAGAMTNYFVIRNVQENVGAESVRSTIGTSPSVRRPRGRDSCRYAKDGLCDEPDLCDPGTDTTDCADDPSSDEPIARPWNQRPIEMPPPAWFCCDVFGNRRCQMFAPAVVGGMCFCPGQGAGQACY